MMYQPVTKRTEVLQLITSYYPIYATSLIVFSLLIGMPRFESINFYQNKPKIKLFLQIFECRGSALITRASSG